MSYQQNSANALSTRDITSRESDALAVYDNDVRRLAAFKALKREVPRDHCNLPIFLYRIDLIQNQSLLLAAAAPRMQACSQAQIFEIESARMSVVWEEGFPALEDGSALWGKWEFEDPQIHQAFLEYLELAKHVGMRSINDLAILGETASQLGRERIYEAFICFYWDDRARAYDLYEKIRQKRLREKRILSTNDRHFLETEKLLTQLYTKYFGNIDEETGNPVWIEDLTPKDAIKALETLTKIQRDSLGLQSSGTSSKNGEVEESLDTPDQIKGAMQDLSTKTKRKDAVEEEDVLALLREDDDAAEAAQSLIVSLNRHRNLDRDPAGSAISGGTGGANDGISVEDERRLQEKLAAQQTEQQTLNENE